MASRCIQALEELWLIFEQVDTLAWNLDIRQQGSYQLEQPLQLTLAAFCIIRVFANLLLVMLMWFAPKVSMLQSLIGFFLSLVCWIRFYSLFWIFNLLINPVRLYFFCSDILLLPSQNFFHEHFMHAVREYDLSILEYVVYLFNELVHQSRLSPFEFKNHLVHF